MPVSGRVTSPLCPLPLGGRAERHHSLKGKGCAFGGRGCYCGVYLWGWGRPSCREFRFSGFIDRGARMDWSFQRQATGHRRPVGSTG